MASSSLTIAHAVALTALLCTTGVATVSASALGVSNGAHDSASPLLPGQALQVQEPDPSCICPNPINCTCCGPNGCFFWSYPNTDCPRNDATTHCVPESEGGTLQACQTQCQNEESCGGFTWPQGIKKTATCFDQLEELWPGLPARTLHLRNMFPPRKEYIWRYNGFNCMNHFNEIGYCGQGMAYNDLVVNCSRECQKSPFCGGFNTQGHMKSLSCSNDNFHSGVDLYLLRNYPQNRSHLMAPPFSFESHEHMDCDPGFELGQCEGEAQCRELCMANPFCGGFNLPNGHMKTMDCGPAMQSSTRQTLYVIKGASVPAASQK